MLQKYFQKLYFRDSTHLGFRWLTKSIESIYSLLDSVKTSGAAIFAFLKDTLKAYFC